MQTDFVAAVYGGSASFPAAAAAAGGTDKAVLFVLLTAYSSSATGPTAVTFGGAAMSFTHRAVARTAGAGSGTYRHEVTAVLGLDAITPVGSAVSYTWSGVTPDPMMMLFTGGRQDIVAEDATTWGTAGLSVNTSGSPYIATYSTPSVQVPASAAAIAGAMHIVGAIGGGSANTWLADDTDFTVVDLSNSPPPAVNMAYSAARAAPGTVQVDLTIGCGLTNDTTDIPPTFAFVLQAYGAGGGGGGPSDADGYNYNCVCDDGNANETLEDLRTRMLLRLGFGSTASNPPPGMADTVDQFLISQNKLVYQKYPALRTRRFFKWVMSEGVRFYGITENEQAIECNKYFDVTKPIEGVFVRDLNGAWLPMGAGIPPTFYTTVAQPGIPARYEIRSCIEVFPAPSADGYELWIKAQQTPDAFSEDEDKTTVESELVFLQALADAKAHYGQPDAAAVKLTAMEYLRDLVASTHTTKRYVPNAPPIPPASMPIFIPLNGAPP